MPDEWAADWDDDGDDSDSDPLPPAYYNADAELARELDLSRVWEPATLKFTETPFTIANRRRRESDEAAVAKSKGKMSTARAVNQVTARAGDNQDAGSSRSTITAKNADPPRRRGPVPAKSAKLFGDDPPEEKKQAAKKVEKKWTKAEVDGWKDANGNPIPSNKPAGGKKGAVKAKKSVLDLLNDSAEKAKGGKGKGKGKGKNGAEVTVPAVGAGVELPDEGEVVIKKKRAPAKRKKKDEEEEVDGEENVVKKKAPVRKKKVEVVESEEEEDAKVEKPIKEKEVEVVIEDDEDDKAAVGASDDEPDSLDGLISRKRAKAKRVDPEEEEPPAKKAKPTVKTKKEAVTKGKGKGKAKDSDEEIRFTRLPAGAEPSDKYPIVKLIEHQKTLPTKPKAKPKPKATKATTKKSKPAAPKSSSSRINDNDASAFINSLATFTLDRPQTIDDLMPALNTSKLAKRRPAESEGGESIEPEESDDEDRVKIGDTDDEEEGKKGLMSRYFAQANGEEGPSQTAPTTLDLESTVPDSSSALPSSPTERRATAIRRQDSGLVHPQPVRSGGLPNADKFERLARIAERTKKEGAQAKQQRKNEPDVGSFMGKGLTIAQPPMSANRLRGPKPQIDSRLRGPALQPIKPDLSNTDMFRSPAGRQRKAAADASENADTGAVWGTLGNKPKKGGYTPYDYIPDPSAYLPTRDALNPSSAKTIAQLPKRGLFTPKAAAPEITIPTPKFRTKASGNLGQYGSAASTRAEEAVSDPYKRAERDEGVVLDSPGVETIRSRKGVAYTFQKERGREGERPRYLPAVVSAVGGEEVDEGGGDWREEWKFQGRKERVAVGRAEGRTDIASNARVPPVGYERSSSSFGQQPRLNHTASQNSYSSQRRSSSFDRQAHPNPTARLSAGFDRPSSSFGQHSRMDGVARTGSGNSSASFSRHDRPSSFGQDQAPISRVTTIRTSVHYDRPSSALGQQSRVSSTIPYNSSSSYERPSSSFGHRRGMEGRMSKVSWADDQNGERYGNDNFSAPARSSHFAALEPIPATYMTKSYAPYPTNDSRPRPDSRATGGHTQQIGGAGGSRLSRIPMATFNGSKPRLSATVNAEPGPSQPSGRTGADRGSGRNESSFRDAAGDMGGWRGASGMSFGGYGEAADGGHGGHEEGGRVGFRSAGEAGWESGRA